MSNRPEPRQLLLGGGHLAALWSLAFVQPLLDLLGNNPDFFIARDNTAGDILILSIGFTLLPPLFLLGIELVASRISGRLYNWLHLTFLAVISTFLFIQVLANILPRPTILLLAAAIALGVLFARAAQRRRFVRNLLDVLIVAPVVVLVLFIFVSPTSKAIFPGSDAGRMKVEKGNDHPVVLIIFDELGTSDLMADENRIDARRFPNFARLARQGTWYKNQSTTSPFTPQAVPGMLTGMSLPDDTLPTSWAVPENIFTLLGKDRELHVMENVTKLCPVALCPQNGIRWRQLRRLNALWSDLKYVEGRLVLPPDLADRLPTVDGKFQGFGGAGEDEAESKPFRRLVANKGRGNRDAASLKRFIREIPDHGRALTVLHLALPHHPWRYTAEGRLYNWEPQSQIGENSGKWRVDQAAIATVQARMYVQTGFADRLVGELRRNLEQKGIWDDAIVVVSADHGSSFEGGDVPRRQPSREGMGEIANPPLFIKYPGQKTGRTVTAHSTTLDILPTIARTLSITPPYEFDGVPLQQEPLPDRQVTLHDLDGPPISVSPEEMVRQRNAAIARADERLGDGPLYSLGPVSGLIGREVAPVPAGVDEITLDTPKLWDRIRPSGGPVPVNVTGWLSGDESVRFVAVAVNGAIRGTGATFELDGKTRFGALIDPAVLTAGRNEIAIYAIEDDGQLRPLGGNGQIK